MIDVRRLRVLREVARQGSLAAAARTLGYTPSAVSQHVGHLERELGCALVVRSPNRIELTEAGRLLAERADGVLGALAAAEQQVHAVAGLRVGRLRVGTFGTAAPTLLAPAIQQYVAVFPDAEIVAVEGDPEDSLPRLRDRELDLVVTYEYDLCPLPMDAGLRRRLVHVDPMRVVVPAGDPFAARDRVALAELTGRRWIVEPRPDCRHFTVKVLAAAGLEAEISCESSDYYLAQALVAAGVGLALVPQLALAAPHPGVVAVPLDGATPVRRVFATYRHGEEELPSIRTMLGVLAGIGAV